MLPIIKKWVKPSLYIETLSFNIVSRKHKVLSLLSLVFFVFNGSISNNSKAEVIEYDSVTEYGYAYLADSIINVIKVEVEENIPPVVTDNNRKRYLEIKHTLIRDVMINNDVSRLELLPDSILRILNNKLGEAFVSIVLSNVNAQSHVYKYFTSTKDLNKIETSLMEQAKYHVPASIKLAQSALETAYGQRIVRNNYFGIKAKKSSKKVHTTTTTEYYNQQEFNTHKNIIVSFKPVVKEGKNMYKCIVKDYFSEYSTPWESFREHSIFLSTNDRYAKLFTKGKDYRDWADTIGSTKFGGVGYATSPDYGKVLKDIIKRYQLDLLDY